VVIPDAGHFPHAERPDRFFPLVESFLAQTDDGSDAEQADLDARLALAENKSSQQEGRALLRGL